MSVAWLHEQHVRANSDVDYAPTDGMAAAIFAKSMHVPVRCVEARKLIFVFASPDELISVVSNERHSPHVTVAACLCPQSFGSDAFCPQSAGARAVPPTLCDNVRRIATEEP